MQVRVFSRVSPRCPQLYYNHCSADKGSQGEKDGRVADTVVRDLKFKVKADDACLIRTKALWPALAGHPQTILYSTDASVGKESFL